jgi:hypothetical protein
MKLKPPPIQDGRITEKIEIIGRHKQEFQMDGNNILSNPKALEIVFRLKLEVLYDIIKDGSFRKEITTIKILVSDLLEIAANIETERQEVLG